jgi:cephalosporin hydroxylase
MKIELDKKYFEKNIIKQDEKEIMAFVDFIAEGPPIKNVIEIGTYCGGTANIWAQMVEPNAGRVFCVDILFNHKGMAPIYRGTRLAPFIREFQGKSQDQKIIDSIKKHLNGELVDLLFVDADHSDKAVRDDYKNFSQFVRKGGWIAFHDIVNQTVEVKNLWGELKAKFESKEFIIGAGIGVIKWV